ncbi:phospholipid-binding protein MlaC [Marinobacter sp. AL4B]|uniref:MlaC/ttg2D family ABC transporter substrate-binding protein n=1 Tax=Marinobacter sp. AL4B TaxID=2871173 RepID=UPI001CAA5400|nr:ABC transporter substrate-binding protein [Marinobacter sp. AL4B]MBZ0333164.1 ABC transporter substrate-binding protein [Marinobacter sp. AL4B]
MLMFKRKLFVVFALLMMVAGQAWAGVEEDLEQYVSDNTQMLVQKLNTEKGLFERDPDAFYQSMDDALTDFVDFRRIAARVMGRYARQTTREQRDEFVTKFKRSLFDTYAKALVTADDFKIEVKEAEILPQNENRASVQLLVITASGNRYPVTYSMYKNNGERWLMENVIVEGVNIGLAFRDRFAQEMEESRGQVQVVIDGWTDSVKSLKLEEDVNPS